MKSKKKTDPSIEFVFVSDSDGSEDSEELEETLHGGTEKVEVNVSASRTMSPSSLPTLPIYTYDQPTKIPDNVRLIKAKKRARIQRVLDRLMFDREELDRRVEILKKALVEED